VLKGAAAIMIEKGIGQFTVDEIVERTGVALSTIYRHWPSRNELLADAIVFAAEPRSVPDTGSTRGDLIEFLTGRTRHVAERWDARMRTLPGLIEAGRTDAAVGAAVTEVVGRLLRCLATILARGQGRGEVRRDRDVDAVADVLLGALFIHGGYRGIANSDAYEGGYVERTVDIILHGVGTTPH
jgi:AcrR family transcriptional regulator